MILLRGERKAKFLFGFWRFGSWDRLAWHGVYGLSQCLNQGPLDEGILLT